MDKTRGKVKYGFIIGNIIVAALFLVFAFLEYQNRNNNLIQKDTIYKKYQELMNDETLGENEINDINNKIEELNNIDELTEKKKTDVFKLASELEKKIGKKETNYKIAYLTFDDGPYYNTFKVLDILKKNKVKATFFTTNVNGEKCYDNKNYNCQELYAYYKKDNHTIANHTYTHGWNKGLYKSADNFISAIKKQEELVKSKTGIITNIARFPGGSSTPRVQGGQARLNSMIEALRKNGYGWVDWTAQDGDGGSLNNRNTGWNNFKNSINDNIEVVLFHDYNKVTTDILPDVIKYLQDKNYIILPLFYESVMINK